MVLCLLVNIRVCALIDNSGSMGMKKTGPLCISASSETLSMLIKRNEGGGKNEITEHNVINKISRRDGRTWNKTNPLEILGIEKKKQWHHVTTNTSKVNHLHNSRQLHQTEVSLTFILIRGVFLRGMRGKEGCQRPWTTKWKYFELVNERYATRNKISTSFFFWCSFRIFSHRAPLRVLIQGRSNMNRQMDLELWHMHFRASQWGGNSWNYLSALDYQVQRCVLDGAVSRILEESLELRCCARWRLRLTVSIIYVFEWLPSPWLFLWWKARGNQNVSIPPGHLARVFCFRKTQSSIKKSYMLLVIETKPCAPCIYGAEMISFCFEIEEQDIDMQKKKNTHDVGNNEESLWLEIIQRGKTQLQWSEK